MSDFLRFLEHDWYFAIPLFLLAFTGTGLVIWRLLLNINADTRMSEFLPRFRQILQDEGVTGAMAYCQRRYDIIPRRLFTAGLANHRMGLATMRRAMNDVMRREVLPELRFLLPTILAIAKVATTLGLFVTVISMIGTFTAIQQSRGGDATDPAGAIGLALFGVAMGLVGAIPLVFAHVLFQAWIVQFEAKMKAAAWDLVGLLSADRP